MKSKILFPLAILVLTACTGGESGHDAPGMDQVAREYLFLELSMGLHDPGHVDAYFGPEEIRDAANKTRLAVDEIGERVDALRLQIDALPAATGELEQMRIDGLVGRLLALETRIAMMMGEKLSFDEESRRLFGAAAPDHDAGYFQAILDEIDELVGGEGPLSERTVAFRDQFVIPPDKLDEVFDAAIAECRRRTLLYIDLPENESFTLEYVNDKPWSGYNWYQGNWQSLIQINTDLPILISRAVDLGCHEGYPGHHTFNALLEKNLVDDKGWLEFSLYPLFSPQSLIAEGSGNYGIDLAFPGEERIAFERDVLFPLAGLDSANADRFYELLELLARLDYAGNEAARDYLNGTITRSEAVQWLVDYALTSPERARQRTEFFDTYRSYVINYNLGKDIVRAYVERDGAGEAQRWTRFEQMLSSPMTAADLQ
ncbi:MAG: hypothetical protein OEM63_07075 [Gammaproteobacteria bacterium]|nr:hypothetical protein [Gammaproteobacteria bacterium]